MSYFSLFEYTKWYNWYYGITEEERVVVVERIEIPVSIAELETQQESVTEAVPVVSKKKSTFTNYHLRK